MQSSIFIIRKYHFNEDAFSVFRFIVKWTFIYDHIYIRMNSNLSVRAIIQRVHKYINILLKNNSSHIESVCEMYAPSAFIDDPDVINVCGS